MRFWSNLLPNRFDVRRQLLAIGILLALTAIAGAVVLKPSHRKPDSWDSLKKDVAKRAQVDLFDDFQGGLDSWESVENLGTWSYDNGGLAIPGKLALLTPSIQMTDYDAARSLPGHIPERHVVSPSIARQRRFVHPLHRWTTHRFLVRQPDEIGRGGVLLRQRRACQASVGPGHA